MEKEELKALFKEALCEAGIIPYCQPKRYVYGQQGIADLFHCSIPTASRILKDGKIDGAISRIGRKIVVDADKALELANQKSGGRKWKK